MERNRKFLVLSIVSASFSIFIALWSGIIETLIMGGLSLALLIVSIIALKSLNDDEAKCITATKALSWVLFGFQTVTFLFMISGSAMEEMIRRSLGFESSLSFIRPAMTFATMAIYMMNGIAISKKTKAGGLPSKSKGEIEFISGEYMGATINFDTSIILGRDKSCQFIFKDESISRSHVIITYNKGTKKYILNDKSHNGTFQETGGSITKLPVNMETIVDKGTKILLGDKKQAFILK